LHDALPIFAASEALMGQAAKESRAKLQGALDLLDAKIQRWVEAFEQGADPEVLGTERLRTLKEERAQIVTQLHDTPEPRPLPPYVFKSTVQERFRTVVERALKSMNRAEVRPWLDLLIERAEIANGDVVVQVRGLEMARQI